MKLIKPNVVILEQQPGLDGMYKQIELAGRTCYKSEDKITEDSAKAFVDRMIASGHGAMLEHGTVYLAIPKTTYAPEAINTYLHNPYSRVNECNEFIFTDKYGDKVSAWCVTTNYRVLVENDCLEDLEFFCEPTKYHEKRITVKWTCDRGVSHEFVRHRVFSFAMESTRQWRLKNEITFIIPSWAEVNKFGEIIADDNECFYFFKQSLEFAESNYFTLLNNGWKPQQARQVLSNALKTELVMTGFESDWKHFFSLRSPKYGAKGVHPDAAYLADKLYNMMYIEKDICLSVVHSDEFDGKNNLVKDGDMITYNTLHDKNKDEYTIDSVIITPKDGEKKYLSREEYFKLLVK